MTSHCDICAEHPDAFRLGYAVGVRDSKPVTVDEIEKGTLKQDLSGWWTAYYHGRGFARSALVA